MRTHSVFIGGPIQHALEDGRVSEDLARLLSDLMSGFEKRGHEVYSAHAAEKWGRETDRYSPEEVTHRDYHWMRSADVYLCCLPLRRDGAIWHSGGTHVELGWASALSVPALILWEPSAAVRYSHLLRGLHAVATVEYLGFRGTTVDMVVDKTEELFGLAADDADGTSQHIA